MRYLVFFTHPLSAHPHHILVMTTTVITSHTSWKSDPLMTCLVALSISVKYDRNSSTNSVLNLHLGSRAVLALVLGTLVVSGTACVVTAPVGSVIVVNATDVTTNQEVQFSTKLQGKSSRLLRLLSTCDNVRHCTLFIHITKYWRARQSDECHKLVIGGGGGGDAPAPRYPWYSR